MCYVIGSCLFLRLWQIYLICEITLCQITIFYLASSNHYFPFQFINASIVLYHIIVFMTCLLTSNLIELTLSSYFPLVEYFDITALQEAINKKKMTNYSFITSFGPRCSSNGFSSLVLYFPWLRKSEGVLKWLIRIYRILKIYENPTVVFSVLTSCFFCSWKKNINYHLSFSEIQGLWLPRPNLACYWLYKHTSQCLNIEISNGQRSISDAAAPSW